MTSPAPQMMAVADIQERTTNAKQHPKSQVTQIANSIKQFGFLDPIEVDADGVVIAGHGRLKAAKQLKMVEVPVIRHDMRGVEADVYALTHNRATLASGLNMEDAIGAFQTGGITAEEAAVAGITPIEFELFAPMENGDDTLDFTGEELENTEPAPRRPRRIVFRFYTEAQDAQFMAVLARLRTEFPRTETHAERFLAYCRAASE